MWVKCLDTLALIDQPKLIHYGSYETQFLRRMKARYCSAPMNAELIDYMISSSVNLLSFTYAQIYFPTYSNTLKEVARFLGFEWSERDPSGLRALMWRSEWENSRDSGIKQELTTYNAEDCAAVQKVADAIARVCDEQRTTDAAVDSIVLSDGVLLAHELSLFGVSVPSRSRIVVDPVVVLTHTCRSSDLARRNPIEFEKSCARNTEEGKRRAMTSIAKSFTDSETNKTESVRARNSINTGNSDA